MKNDKLHWYAMSYYEQDIETGKQCQASTYMGYSDKLLTINRIREAKKDAKVTDTAVLMAATYMGHATRAEILGE